MTVLTSSLIVKLIDAVSAPAKKAAESLKGIGRAAQGLNGTRVSGSMVDNLGKSLEATTRKIDALRSRMLEAAAVGYGLSRALSAPLSTAREFESTLLDIAQKGDLSDAAMAKVGRQVGELAGKLKKSLSQNELAKGVDILAGFGLDTDRAMTLLEPIGRATVAYKSTVEDLSKAGFSALDNMKVPAEQFGKALDVMAQAGKEGAFELKDMAREFPSLTAAAQALGMAGVDGVAKLSAALQIAHKGAGSGSEAATNTANMMQKIASPETLKKFKKFGIDIRGELKKVQDKGGDVFEMIAGLVMKATKGDLSKMGDLFEDSQVQQFLRPLIANLEEYKRIRDKAAGASGVVDADFERRLKTGDAALTTFKNRLEDLGRSIGAAILPAVNAMMGSLGGLVDTFASLAERFPALTATLVALTAGLVALRVAAIAAAFAGLQLKAAWLGAALAGAQFRAAIAAAAVMALAPFKAAALVLLGVLQTIALRFRLAAAAGLAFNRALLVGTLATFTRGLGAAAVGLLALLSPMRLVRGALVLLRGALLASGIGAALVAFGAAATWISNNWSGIGKAFEAFKTAFLTSIKPILGDPAVQGLIDVAGKIAAAWEAITGKVDEGTMTRFGAAAGEAIGGIVKRVVELRNELLETLSLIPGLGFLKPKADKPADPRDGARRVGPKAQDDRQEPGFDWGEFFTPAPGGDLVGTWATKLRTWLKVALAGLAAEIAVQGVKVGVALAEGIGSAAGAIGASAADLASRLVGAAAGLPGLLASAGRRAIAALANGMRSAAGTVAAWASGLVLRLISALSGLAGGLAGTGRAAGRALVRGLRTAAGAVGGWASGLVSAVLGPVSGLAAALATCGAKAIAGLEAAIRSAATSATTWLSSLPDLLVGALSGLAAGLASAGGQAGSALVEGIRGAGASLTAWASSTAAAIAGSFSGLASSLASTGSAAIAGLLDGMKTAGSGLASWIAGLATTASSSAAGIGQALASIGTSAVAGLANALRSGAASAGAWLSGLSGQIAGALSGLSSTLQATGSAAMSGLWNGMRSVWPSIVAWASGLAGQIAAAFSNLAGQLSAAGAAAMQGLWDGMKSIGESIVGWASGLAGRIAGTFAGIGGKIRGALGGAGAAPAGGGGGAPAAAPAAPAAPARATGGHVKAGQVYRVNDDRTDDPVELFRPNRSGTVLPSSERKKIAGDRPAPSDRAPLIRLVDRLSGIGEEIRSAMSRREPSRTAPGDALTARFDRVLGAFRDKLEAGQQPVRYASAPPVATPSVRPPAPVASAPAPAAVPVGPRPIARPEPRQAPATPAAAPAAAAGASFTFNPTFNVHGAADPAAFAREAMTVMKREAERARRTLFADSGLRTV